MSRLTSFFGRSTTLRRALWLTGDLLHHRLPPAESIDRADRMDTAHTVPVRNWKDSSPPFFPLEPVPAAANPVLTATDVTDYGTATGVADPFLFVTDNGKWHMFFEVFNRNRTPTAVIGHATSFDGYVWTYDQVVLATGFHLSFPYVFEADGAHYMVPDAWAKQGSPADVILYEAEQFPTTWTPVATIISPSSRIHDCVVFQWRDRWWALAGEDDSGDLYAYHAERLEADGWQPHEANPVVTDRSAAARPGGRPIVTKDSLLVYFQDCVRQYGDMVRAYEITELSPTKYVDHEMRESPILGADSRRFGWDAGKMHHIDLVFVGDGWHCAVDGNIGIGQSIFDNNWAIGIYQHRSAGSNDRSSGVQPNPERTRRDDGGGGYQVNDSHSASDPTK